MPVCSPALLEARGRPAQPHDLHRWPLLYDLVWARYWSHWFAHHRTPPANLSRASGFRLYSVMVQAAVKGLGVALGHTRMIAGELDQGTLVPLFDGAAPSPRRPAMSSASHPTPWTSAAYRSSAPGCALRPPGNPPGRGNRTRPVHR